MNSVIQGQAKFPLDTDESCVVIDPTRPPQCVRTVAPIAYEKTRISPNGAVTMGGKNTFVIPRLGYVQEIALEVIVDSGAPSAAYSPAFALDIIENFRLKSGGKTIHDYYMRDVARALLNKMPANRTVSTQIAAGAIGAPSTLAGYFNNGVFIIPTFFSQFWNPGRNQPPLDLRQLKSDLIVELDFRSLADISRAGSGHAVNGINLIVYGSETSEVLERMHSESGEKYCVHSFDWTTFPLLNAPAGVTTAFDISGVSGNIMRIDASLDLQSTYLTKTTDLLQGVGAENSQLLINGKEYAACDSFLESYADALVYGQGRNSGVADYVSDYKISHNIEYSFAGVQYMSNGEKVFGYLATDSVNSLVLKMTNGNATDAYAGVVCTQHAKYAVVDGFLRRDL